MDGRSPALRTNTDDIVHIGQFGATASGNHEKISPQRRQLRL
jgi:hypothetical protein